MENERVEWMWRISDEDIYLRLKKNTFMCQTSERAEPSERAEQIWSGWSNLVWVEQIWSGWNKFAWVEQIWSGWSGCGQNSVESS